VFNTSVEHILSAKKKQTQIHSIDYYLFMATTIVNQRENKFHDLIWFAMWHHYITPVSKTWSASIHS